MNGDWLYEELREYPPEAWRLVQNVDKFPLSVQVMPTVVGVWENYKLYLSRGHELSKWHRNVPSYFTFDDHELVNDIWGSSEAGKRHRRTVFRDIGTYAWMDYLGWANPMEYGHPIHFGRGGMKAGSDLLVDPNADFTKLPLSEMTNLHVHWGTPEAGVNDLKYDDDSGNKNSYVYDIVDVVDRHTLANCTCRPRSTTRISAIRSAAAATARSASPTARFYLLDTRGDRDMHDLRQRDKPGVSMIGKHQREWMLKSMKESDADFFFVVSTVPFMIPHSGAGGFEFDEANKEEAWTGFFDEREMLIREWDKLGKEGLRHDGRPAQQLRHQGHRRRVGVLLRTTQQRQPRPQKTTKAIGPPPANSSSARASATSAGAATSCPTCRGWNGSTPTSASSRSTTSSTSR